MGELIVGEGNDIIPRQQILASRCYARFAPIQQIDNLNTGQEPNRTNNDMHL